MHLHNRQFHIRLAFTLRFPARIAVDVEILMQAIRIDYPWQRQMLFASRCDSRIARLAVTPVPTRKFRLSLPPRRFHERD